MNRIALVVVGAIAFASTCAVPAAASAGENCSFRLVPVSKTGSVTTADLELIGCYVTYEEAIEAGAAGSVDVSADITPDTLSTSEVAEISAASDVLIGTEWSGVSYSLASNSYYAPATCSASNTWQLNYVGADWNDRFDSGKGFGGCDHNKKFEAADYGGAVITCTPNCVDYGTLANEVSSLRWKP
jgi:hypothetical protein